MQSNGDCADLQRNLVSSVRVPRVVIFCYYLRVHDHVERNVFSFPRFKGCRLTLYMQTIEGVSNVDAVLNQDSSLIHFRVAWQNTTRLPFLLQPLK